MIFIIARCCRGDFLHYFMLEEGQRSDPAKHWPLGGREKLQGTLIKESREKGHTARIRTGTCGKLSRALMITHGDVTTAVAPQARNTALCHKPDVDGLTFRSLGSARSGRVKLPEQRLNHIHNAKPSYPPRALPQVNQAMMAWPNNPYRHGDVELTTQS